MQARGYPDHRLKYCWPEVIYCSYLLYCICQRNELKREIKKKTGGQTGDQTKIWGGMAHPSPPLESPLPKTRVKAKCAERSHQQPLVGFIKLRIAIHSEKQNETESVHQHAFKATQG